MNVMNIKIHENNKQLHGWYKGTRKRIDLRTIVNRNATCKGIIHILLYYMHIVYA